MKRWGLTIPLIGVPLMAHRELVERLPDLVVHGRLDRRNRGQRRVLSVVAGLAVGAPAEAGHGYRAVSTRGPGLLAMSAATLADAAPGRFVLGIGASSPVIASDWNAGSSPNRSAGRGTPAVPPCGAGGAEGDRAVCDVLGERVPVGTGARSRAGIMLAALRPGMLRLAAREADGAITNWLAPMHEAWARAIARPPTPRFPTGWSTIC